MEYRKIAKILLILLGVVGIGLEPLLLVLGMQHDTPGDMYAGLIAWGQFFAIYPAILFLLSWVLYIRKQYVLTLLVLLVLVLVVILAPTGIFNSLVKGAYVDMNPSIYRTHFVCTDKTFLMMDMEDYVDQYSVDGNDLGKLAMASEDQKEIVRVKNADSAQQRAQITAKIASCKDASGKSLFEYYPLAPYVQGL